MATLSFRPPVSDGAPDLIEPGRVVQTSEVTRIAGFGDEPETLPAATELVQNNL